jgi:hypothetical protein
MIKGSILFFLDSDPILEMGEKTGITTKGIFQGWYISIGSRRQSLCAARLSEQVVQRIAGSSETR